MRTRDFHYELPTELIAQAPLARRSDARLLVVRRPRDGQPAALEDRTVRDLPQLLSAGDRLVFNDTRVIPARLHGRKASGGRVEILLERLLDERQCLAMVRASKTPKTGSELIVDEDFSLEVLGRQDEFFHLRSRQGELMAQLERLGHVPLPPYIQRQDEAADRDRYQTVFARRPGAVAAPTAGLHFDDELLAALAAAGIDRSTVTLHVGAGTFQPVRVTQIQDHRMHAEWLSVEPATVEEIRTTRTAGGRVVSVGTTCVRSLETAAADGPLAPFQGDSRLFITPGYTFRVVDALLTNFHLPESTLLMLVAALAGYDLTFKAYRHAVRERYRFFSYGDAMLIL